jgi:hypothetical protein
MENFFIDDKFYSDIDSLLSDYDEEEIINLPDDWEVDCKESKLESIFAFDEQYIVDSVLMNTDKWEERFPEDSERIDNEIRVAVKKGFDIEKINNLLPKLYYPNDNKFKIKKQDLLDYIK